METQKNNELALTDDVTITETNNQLPLPWEILDDEPIESFSCFEFYLSLGPSRSLTRVSERLKVSIDKLKKYSSKWNWTKRAKSHDLLKFEITKHKELSEIEMRNQEVEKLRIRFSKMTKRALLDLMECLDHYWANYNNSELKAKINHINKLTSTINNLINYTHIDLSPENQILLSKRNIKINNILNLNNDIITVNNEKTNIYNYLDYDVADQPPPQMEYGEEPPLPKNFHELVR